MELEELGMEEPCTAVAVAGCVAWERQTSSLGTGFVQAARTTTSRAASSASSATRLVRRLLPRQVVCLVVEVGVVRVHPWPGMAVVHIKCNNLIGMMSYDSKRKPRLLLTILIQKKNNVSRDKNTSGFCLRLLRLKVAKERRCA